MVTLDFNHVVEITQDDVENGTVDSDPITRAVDRYFESKGKVSFVEGDNIGCHVYVGTACNSDADEVFEPDTPVDCYTLDADVHEALDAWCEYVEAEGSNYSPEKRAEGYGYQGDAVSRKDAFPPQSITLRFHHSTAW